MCSETDKLKDILSDISNIKNYVGNNLFIIESPANFPLQYYYDTLKYIHDKLTIIEIMYSNQ